jgi:hypothetical protein
LLSGIIFSVEGLVALTFYWAVYLVMHLIVVWRSWEVCEGSVHPGQQDFPKCHLYWWGIDILSLLLYDSIGCWGSCLCPFMSVPDGAIPLYFGVLYGVIRVLTLELCTGR